MRNFLFIILFILMFLCGFACAETYNYSAFIFDTQELSKNIENGEGNPDICKDLFNGEHIYNGLYFPIPKDATVCGAITVTDGVTCKIIPLFNYTDKKGIENFICNGPTPVFAHMSKTENELMRSIIDIIKKK
ncbi:MAG: hypothetical protein HY810_06300 [Candidatus Omnitrophica bacterium]|nr:hypothetical protein [Candidatus Omnitrophota bacterium]